MTEETIFHAALEKSSEERAAFLEQACATDTALRHRVDILLKAHANPARFMRQPAVNAPTPDSWPAKILNEMNAPAEQPGAVIGPYKLLEQIGEGGMGLVFMAEQTQPMRRKVALKILKPGMDTRQVVARFDAERQAVALMNHPNIAQVFDAGATPTGRPYFVMELVRGVPITEFCDQRRLTTRQRLELFVTVCQAVQHAHQKGIIHRDLKPSNILVTLHDVVAVPKIIDFGIAKATTQPLTERSLFTHFSQMIGTPLYMSPEQAEMNALDVDTRSDVYSLGVLLYELLTGTTPFESDRLKQIGFDEMRRVIREEEPPRPSQRVSTLEAAARSTLSEQRGTDVRTFDSMLRGELDWIVIKALEKDRNRRYESASAFAADVQRYLNNEAVEACPPSAVYRIGKIARRHRRTLLLAGLMAAVLITATVVSAWQAVEADVARRLADNRLEKEKQARQEAAQESAIAKAINDFLQTDLLKLADRQVQTELGFVADPNLSVRDALHRAAAKIGQRFQGQPLVEAAIRTTIGQAYLGVGEGKIAVSHLERALALYEGNLAADHPQVLTSMDNLANAYGIGFVSAAAWKASPLRQKSLELRKSKLGPDHPDSLDTMERLAVDLTWEGRFEEAISVQAQALERRKAVFGPEDPSTIACMQGLVHTYHLGRQWDIAVPLAEQLYEKAKDKYGLGHADMRSSMWQLGRAYELVGRLDDAFELYEKALRICREMKAPDIGMLMIYARGCQKAGKLEKADNLLREGLELVRTWDGMYGAVATADFLQYLALNMLLQRRYVEAEPYAREALSIFEKSVPDSWWHFHGMSVMGAAFLGQQKYAEAKPLILEGYEGMKERESLIFAPQKVRVAESLERVIWFYEATNQPEIARAWREKINQPKVKQ